MRLSRTPHHSPIPHHAPNLRMLCILGLPWSQPNLTLGWVCNFYLRRACPLILDGPKLNSLHITWHTPRHAYRQASRNQDALPRGAHQEAHAERRRHWQGCPGHSHGCCQGPGAVYDLVDRGDVQSGPDQKLQAGQPESSQAGCTGDGAVWFFAGHCEQASWCGGSGEWRGGAEEKEEVNDLHEVQGVSDGNVTRATELRGHDLDDVAVNDLHEVQGASDDNVAHSTTELYVLEPCAITLADTRVCAVSWHCCVEEEELEVGVEVGGWCGKSVFMDAKTNFGSDD